MLIFTLAEDNHGDIGTFSSIQEAFDFMKSVWNVTKIESVNYETDQDVIAKEIESCENGRQTIEIDTDNGLFYISPSEIDAIPKTAYVVMTDDGECFAIRGTRKDALMVIFKDQCGENWREEYEIETVDEMLDEIDTYRSFHGMYVVECNNCQF